MKLYKLILTVIIALVYHLPSVSQTTGPHDSLNIVMIVAPNDQTMNVGDMDFKINTSLIYKAIIRLSDTVGVAKLHFKLGSTNGASNYLNKEFIFDQSGIFSDGTAYVRKKNIVYLTLGTYSGITNYFAELKTENTLGAFTQILKLTNSN